MAAKKSKKRSTAKPASKAKSAPKKPVNKSAFVRSLPRTMPAKEVVTKATAAGIAVSEKYVSTIRYNAKASRKKKAAKSTSNGAGAVAVAPAKRGPGRPRTAANGDVDHGGNGHVTTDAGNGLVAMIEGIVEAKVTQILQANLGSLFG